MIKSKSFSFQLDKIPDLYRYDTPTPAEYTWTYCSRCKRFHMHDPLLYNKAVDAMAESMADAIDKQITDEINRQSDQYQ